MGATYFGYIVGSMFPSSRSNPCKGNCVELCVMRHKQADRADSVRHMGAQCSTYPGDVRDMPGFMSAQTIAYGGVGDAMRPHQALETLDTVRSLLKADSAEPTQRAASSEITSLALSSGQPPGQTGSFDSASSQEQRRQEPAGFKALQEPHAGTIARAPPPPAHAEHAVSEPSHSVSAQEARSSAFPGASAQPSQPGNTQVFFRRVADLATALSQQGALQQGVPQDSPRLRHTPFAIARRHTMDEESAHAQQSMYPRQRGAEHGRVYDWTGQQMGLSGKDAAGRPLSSFTSAELGALQAHDRGRQGQGQGPARTLSQASPHAPSQRSSAELARSSEDTGSPSRTHARPISRRSSIEVFESLNCPIVDYGQLQIKRKIGDGSIGLVSDCWILSNIALVPCMCLYTVSCNSGHDAAGDVRCNTTSVQL